ncbi:uncharacterized protein LOC132191579 [Corylus avellana]|uniref:uncharacterized protein LOC132191579 n=1 Tax=Corylus avellana TaxID=13451 RepID=UPI00286C7481|nr:uncharacterized protein LOC132191579 [Corylus avellana]
MEIELFLREILRQDRFGHTSSGGSHVLKLLEKVKNDGKEELVCEFCKEPIVPYPAFKCSVCRFLCHVSCLGSTRLYESTFFFHFGRRHEQLIITEELKNDGEGVVCMVCKEKVEGPGYKCSADECNFQLHKSCAQLPREMHHPSHPNHILILQRPSSHPSNCNACGKSCGRSIFYHCEECDFVIDTTCAFRTQVNNTDNCQHAFVPFFRQIHFTCDACGREGTDFASFCTICRLLIHSRCAGFPRTVIISRHNHTLTLTYSLHHQVKDFNNVFCKLCDQKVKTKYAALSCQECDFVAHMYCAKAYRRESLSEKSVDECDFVAHMYCAKAYRRESLSEKSVDVMEKIINPGEIQHFSHPHNLILSPEEVLHDKLCDGCMHFIFSAPFYNCMECNFFLHTTCAHLPKAKKHILHQHTLTLLPNAPYLGGLFFCNACGDNHHGFTYRCNTCEYDLDVQCCLVPETLKHDGHQHSLFLPASSNKNCSACDNDNEQPKVGVFECTACDFTLGFECATLLLVARHKYDEHLLALTYVAEEDSKEYYCLICEKERDPKYWFYYCAKCDFPAHPQCVLGKYPYIKFGQTFESSYHQHPFTFVQTTKYSPPCDACGNIIDIMALECTQCKFNVHYSDQCLEKVSNKVLHP